MKAIERTYLFTHVDAYYVQALLEVVDGHVDLLFRYLATFKLDVPRQHCVHVLPLQVHEDYILQLLQPVDVRQHLRDLRICHWSLRVVV